MWNAKHKGVYVLYSDNPAPFNNSPAHNTYPYAVFDKIAFCQLVIDGVDRKITGNAKHPIYVVTGDNIHSALSPWTTPYAPLKEDKRLANAKPNLGD